MPIADIARAFFLIYPLSIEFMVFMVFTELGWCLNILEVRTVSN